MTPLFRLRRRTRIAARHLARSTRGAVMLEMAFAIPFLVLVGFGGLEIANLTLAHTRVSRSEERRVGKECVSTCRSRWSPDHYKQNTQRSTHVQHNHNTTNTHRSTHTNTIQ